DLRRVGIKRVAGTVIIDGTIFDNSPLRNPNRLGEFVEPLPVEIIVWQIKYGFRLAARVYQSNHERLAPEVHMNRDSKNKRVSFEFTILDLLIVALTGRNLYVIRPTEQPVIDLFNDAIGVTDPHGGLVHNVIFGGSVVYLKGKPRPLFDNRRLSIR